MRKDNKDVPSRGRSVLKCVGYSLPVILVGMLLLAWFRQQSHQTHSRLPEKEPAHIQLGSTEPASSPSISEIHTNNSQIDQDSQSYMSELAHKALKLSKLSLAQVGIERNRTLDELIEVRNEIIAELGTDPQGALIRLIEGESDEDAAILYLHSLMGYTGGYDVEGIFGHLLGLNQSARWGDDVPDAITRHMIEIASLNSMRHRLRAEILESFNGQPVYKETDVPALMRLFQRDESEIVRLAALRLLVSWYQELPEIHHDAIIALARETLGSKNEQMRVVAARALAQDPLGPTILLSTLLTESSPTVKRAMAGSLVYWLRFRKPSPQTRDRIGRVLLDLVRDENNTASEYLIQNSSELLTLATRSDLHSILRQKVLDRGQMSFMSVDALMNLAQIGYLAEEIGADFQEWSQNEQFTDELRAACSNNLARLAWKKDIDR